MSVEAKKSRRALPDGLSVWEVLFVTRFERAKMLSGKPEMLSGEPEMLILRIEVDQKSAGDAGTRRLYSCRNYGTRDAQQSDKT